MTKKELIKILTIINNAYPGRFEYPKETEVETKLFEQTWYEMLKEYDYELMKTATKKLIATNQYPPSIHEMLKAVRDIQKSDEDEITPGEAWRIALRAAKTAYFGGDVSDIPDRVRRAAECIGGWRRIAMRMEDEDSYLQDRFAKVYSQLKARDEEKAILPPSVLREIKELSSKMEIPKLKSSKEAG